MSKQQLAPTLDRYYRFKDLKELGIVGNWPTLLAWIRERGFPPGISPSPKVRLFPRSAVQDWLDRQASRAA
jgi:hypothetical protein